MLLLQRVIMPLCNGVVLEIALPQGGMAMFGEDRYYGATEYISTGY